jgi:Flp pilus assembly protein TadG
MLHRPNASLAPEPVHTMTNGTQNGVRRAQRSTIASNPTTAPMAATANTPCAHRSSNEPCAANPSGGPNPAPEAHCSRNSPTNATRPAATTAPSTWTGCVTPGVRSPIPRVNNDVHRARA